MINEWLKFWSDPDRDALTEREELIKDSADSMRAGVVKLAACICVLLIIWIISPVLSILATLLGFQFIAGGFAAIFKSIGYLLKLK